MTYQELIERIDQIKADNVTYYGDFGFDFAIEWDDNTVSNLTITWPSVGSTCVADAFRFGEALQAFCFDGNGIVGLTVED